MMNRFYRIYHLIVYHLFLIVRFEVSSAKIIENVKSKKH